jgi:hypothetical protein
MLAAVDAASGPASELVVAAPAAAASGSSVSGLVSRSEPLEGRGSTVAMQRTHVSGCLTARVGGDPRGLEPAAPIHSSATRHTRILSLHSRHWEVFPFVSVLAASLFLICCWRCRGPPSGRSTDGRIRKPGNGGGGPSRSRSPCLKVDRLDPAVIIASRRASHGAKIAPILLSDTTALPLGRRGRPPLLSLSSPAGFIVVVRAGQALVQQDPAVSKRPAGRSACQAAPYPSPRLQLALSPRQPNLKATRADGQAIGSP